MYIKFIYLINMIVFLGIMTYLSYLYLIYYSIRHFEKNIMHITFTVFSVVGTIAFTILFAIAFLIPV